MIEINSLPSEEDYLLKEFTCFGGTHAIFSIYQADAKKTEEKVSLYIYDKKMFKNPKEGQSFLDIARKEFDLEMNTIMLTKQRMYENDSYIVYVTEPVYITLYGAFLSKTLISKTSDELLNDQSVFAYNFLLMLNSIKELNELTFQHQAISSSNLVLLENGELKLTGGYFMDHNCSKIHISDPILRPDVLTPRSPNSDGKTDVTQFILSLLDCYCISDKKPISEHIGAIQQMMNYCKKEDDLFNEQTKKLVYLIDLDLSNSIFAEMDKYKDQLVKGATEELTASELLSILTEDSKLDCYYEMINITKKSVNEKSSLELIKLNEKFISRNLFEKILFPKLLKMFTIDNLSTIINIILTLATKRLSDVSQLYYLFEPILLALTPEKARIYQKVDSFKAYSGFSFNYETYYVENPFAELAGEKTKNLNTFLPNLDRYIMQNSDNTYEEMQIALLEHFAFFLAESQLPECHINALNFFEFCLNSFNANVALAALLCVKQYKEDFVSPELLINLQGSKFAKPLLTVCAQGICELALNTDINGIILESLDSLGSILEYLSENEINLLQGKFIELELAMVKNQPTSIAYMEFLLQLKEKVGQKQFFAKYLKVTGEIMSEWRDDKILLIFKQIIREQATEKVNE